MKPILTTLAITLSLLSSAQQSPASEWYLRTPDSLRIFVTEFGTGPDTVIVVHGGFGANHQYLFDALLGLEKDHHFILYDQRGSLLSPAPQRKLTFQKNVADLALLVDELNINKAKIICHSMGTLVAMEFLEQFPERVKNMILIGALPSKADSVTSIFNERQNNQVRYLQERPEVKELIASYMTDSQPDSLHPLDNESIEHLTDKQKTELWRIYFASVNIYRIDRWRYMKGGRIFYNQLAAVMAETVDWTYDYRKRLNELEKATIIMGDHDFIDFNAEVHKDQLKDYSNVRVEVIKWAGHNPWTDSPDEFRTVLLNSL